MLLCRAREPARDTISLHAAAEPDGTIVQDFTGRPSGLGPPRQVGVGGRVEVLGDDRRRSQQLQAWDAMQEAFAPKPGSPSRRRRHWGEKLSSYMPRSKADNKTESNITLR